MSHSPTLLTSMSYSRASGSKTFTESAAPKGLLIWVCSHAGPLTVMFLTRAPFEEMWMRMSGVAQGPQLLLLLLLPQAIATREARVTNQEYLFMIKPCWHGPSTGTRLRQLSADGQLNI